MSEFVGNDEFEAMLGGLSDEAERLEAIRKYTERAYRCMQAMREVDDPDAFMLTIRGLLDCETPDDFNEIHNFINEIREHLGIEGIYDD